MIFLDTENPRLAKQRHAVEELDILRTLYDEYDLNELAMSCKPDTKKKAHL
ncbi:hypothetical protein [Mucilaginibacter myungsuensis]|uniref:Uncharacterized protein n=1 Tax=Mucilaginibacter myungsuensis TaxID=649104 RepID=A0A929L2W6_9SPHI|nr:hypothetical protein [Mucilaginibacter myungsuensis]MBE9663090.1 hypothetical protein [Mucilaginibacter myungsuensis]MDN3598725.1 hypothetical protein [Mucilaginibacter myungsuensis]